MFLFVADQVRAQEAHVAIFRHQGARAQAAWDSMGAARLQPCEE